MQTFDLYDHRRKAAIFAEILESLDRPVADANQIGRILTPREYLIDSWYSAATARRNNDTRFRYQVRTVRRPGGSGGMNVDKQNDKED